MPPFRQQRYLAFTGASVEVLFWDVDLCTPDKLHPTPEPPDMRENFSWDSDQYFHRQSYVPPIMRVALTKILPGPASALYAGLIYWFPCNCYGPPSRKNLLPRKKFVYDRNRGLYFFRGPRRAQNAAPNLLRRRAHGGKRHPKPGNT